MKQIWLLLLLLAALVLPVLSFAAATPAATPPADPEKQILGDWQGIGMGFLSEIIFTSDHTFYFADEPASKGTWSWQNGQYSLKNSEMARQAAIDSEGRLLLKDPEDPKFEHAFRKKVPVTPAPFVNLPPPDGKWRFAYIKKSSITAGPPFDEITLSKGKAKLQFTPVDKQFEVGCQIVNNAIFLAVNNPDKIFTALIHYMPLGAGYPTVILLGYRWEDGGKTLILSNIQAARPFDCEWVFLRDDQFLSNTLAGNWIGKGSHTGGTMEVNKDGTLIQHALGMDRPRSADKLESPVGYYRLWKSPFGNAISIVQPDPGMQLMHVEMLRYEISGQDIILTPIECKYGDALQLDQTGKSNWKLGTPGESQPAQPAAFASQTTSTLTPLDLAGDWVGTVGGVEIDYSFTPDGGVLMRMTEPEFKTKFPNGVKGRFKFTKGPRFDQLDFYRFENPDMEGDRVRAIFQMIDENTFKMEGGTQGPRPLEFSIEAIAFKRKGPKPKFDAATLAKLNEKPAGPPYKIAGLPRETITLPGGVKFEMIKIPAGKFQMGQPAAQETYSSAHPDHPVTIRSDFSIGQTEVTQAQWIAVMGKWPPDPDPKIAREDKIPSILVGDRLPVLDVSWNDCQQFISALNGFVVKSGQGPGNFRLPSEAEWEYACRAGTQTAFYWGDDPSETLIDNYAWYGENSEASGQEYMPHAAGLKWPNPWGLYDMSGNVSEWCQDNFHGSYKGTSRPDDGSPWLDKPSGPERVHRGGAFDNMAKGVQSHFRTGTPGGFPNATIGLRLARGGGHP